MNFLGSWISHDIILRGKSYGFSFNNRTLFPLYSFCVEERSCPHHEIKRDHCDSIILAPESSHAWWLLCAYGKDNKRILFSLTQFKLSLSKLQMKKVPTNIAAQQFYFSYASIHWYPSHQSFDKKLQHDSEILKKIRVRDF